MFGRPYISDCLPTLQDAVDRGYGPYVREIMVRLCSIDYNFVGTEQHPNPLHVIQSCGQLPSVRSLNFRIEPEQRYNFQGNVMGYNYLYRSVPNIELCDPGRVSDLFCSVVDSIMERMPNIRDVAVYGTDDTLHLHFPDSYSDDEQDDDDIFIDPTD
ncbi:hypothetical protein LPJ61_005256, partial [Coemansia biformis]